MVSEPVKIVSCPKAISMISFIGMTDLLKKLQYRGGQIGISLSPPEFTSLVSEISLSHPVSTKLEKNKDYGLIILFVKTYKEIMDSLPFITPRKKETDLVWFAYPKRSSLRYSAEINRDKGWEPLEKNDFLAVRQISLDKDWSALRFRHRSVIKKLERKDKPQTDSK